MRTRIALLGLSSVLLLGAALPACAVASPHTPEASPAVVHTVTAAPLVQDHVAPALHAVLDVALTSAPIQSDVVAPQTASSGSQALILSAGLLRYCRSVTARLRGRTAPEDDDKPAFVRTRRYKAPVYDLSSLSADTGAHFAAFNKQT